MTLYEKHGNSYIPVHDTQAMEGLPNGSWLITIQDGYTKIRRPVDDEQTLRDMAAMQRRVTEWLVEALRESSAMTCGRGGTISDLEQRAYQAYLQIAGPEATLWMTIPSAADIAERVCEKLVKHLNGAADG